MRLAACDTGKNRYSRMLRNGGDNFTDTARNDGMSSPGDTRQSRHDAKVLIAALR